MPQSPAGFGWGVATSVDQIESAVSAGIDVRGCFCWTLLAAQRAP